MRKTRKKKVKKEAVTSREPVLTPEHSAEAAKSDFETENFLNFGGLPNRDLKKNLGCG
jgi:hypothetical protein